MKSAFIYTEKFGSYIYGVAHPMKPVRLKLAYELMEALGALNAPSSKIIEARKASEDELKLFHTSEYVKVLKEANTGLIPVGAAGHGLGYGDNPVFKGVYDWSLYSTGASIQAAEVVLSGNAGIAFNIAGGLHHAMPGRASGFCYINDAAVAIKHLVNEGKRVAYVDIDAHHGDGVEYAFYETDKALTISLHEDGQWLFPGTGQVTDIGIRQGRGYSVNLPFPPGTGDEMFVAGFKEIVPVFIDAFRPDILVTQLGVDSFATDPLTHLNLTTTGFEETIKIFKSFNLPWVALGGGGYNLSNVARAWTIAWAVMNDIDLPLKMPSGFLRENEDIFEGDSVRDEPVERMPVRDSDVQRFQRDKEFLKKEVLGLIKTRSAGG